MAYTHDLVADCLQFERAFCTAKCPFNLDVRDFIGKLQQGRFNVAYKAYQNAVGFPGIVTALCPEPCRLVCPMKDAGGAISIIQLEKAAMKFARNQDPDEYNMPAKNQRIAIIGAGISGLACALRLITRKYPVTVFEKSAQIGGHLHTLLPAEVFMRDIDRQFSRENYDLRLNTEITSLSALDFDAIYIATGKNGTDFGAESSSDGVFKGGSLIGADTMHALAQGLNAAGTIERYLKTGIMVLPEELSGTKLIADAIEITPGEAVIPANGTSFTRDEALAEAKRCLKCSCDACVRYSPLMSYFKKFPRRITEEVEVTIHPSTLDGNGTVATRLISTCNHCGLCKEVCPQNIDTGEFLLQSHRAMHEKGAMPWAFHEFYLRDMDFSNHEAALTRIPSGYEKSRYLFFPGCQLGASDPRYVTESFRFLTERFPDTALMLHCCGAPAEWAGNDALHQEGIEKIKSDWITLGKPKAIFACPMCKQMFEKYLPEIEGEFLYNLMDEEGIVPIGSTDRATASVFDPCASRNEPSVQKTIRDLAIRSGFELEPLPMEGRLAGCCSYGGQVAIAYPPYAEHIVQAKIEQSENPYITYCANCRDIFAAAKKPVWHILDILFGLGNANRIPPTVTECRNNRLLLKQQILNSFWNETEIMLIPDFMLLISSELKEKLNKALILETDVYRVIESCEQTGMKLFNLETGSFSGHLQIGNTTYWVEYRINLDSGYELLNAYCHRMKIEEA
ncbi:MAG: FAD-dependent oxidoreductase [Bacteroidales bacterium]|nr:FAD-dependent oxidoreductase [Bacteroidales bacterium]